MSDQSVRASDIAVVGLAGRFPGANNIDEFWSNLTQGKESIRFFSDAELQAAGIDPALLANPRYVKAAGILDDVEQFDADFFGFTPRIAMVTDPQHRLLLETASQALEDAGYYSANFKGRIGLFELIIMNDELRDMISSGVSTDQLRMACRKTGMTTLSGV